jgi:hypothetical protein
MATHEIRVDWGDTIDDVIDLEGTGNPVVNRNAAVGAARFMMSSDADWTGDYHGRPPSRILVTEYTTTSAVIADVGPRPEQHGPVS